uniref:Uncharacterized protein n=1 Tax=Heterorhabditis bacteriophora TaxID=37862 RepID=A0A1I7X1F3_HETBA
MIETECFAELNTFFEEDGSLVSSLRADGNIQDDKRNGSSKPGFFSRLFKRKNTALFIFLVYICESIGTDQGMALLD